MKEFIVYRLSLIVIFLFFALVLPINDLRFTISQAYAAGATLSLSPSSGTFNQGCSFSLDILLDTGGVPTDGTDAILFYDPTRFTASKIRSGTIYSDYPGNAIDAQNGRITVSGLSSVSSAFSGKGVLASIDFTVATAAPLSATQIKFDFNPNDIAKTTDSNVVERGTVADILNSVVNGNYVVGAGTCASPSPTPRPSSLPQGGPGISTPSAQPTARPTLPAGGTEGTTYTLAIVGVVLTVIGILGVALL